MPSLIPNYIARLRTHSQSTAASSSSHSASRSNSTAGPPTPGPEHVRLAADPAPVVQTGSNVDTTPQAQVARKIHPDLSALLDENDPPETVEEELGPRPPRRRSRSAGQLASMRPEPVLEPEPEGGQQTGANPPAQAPASPRSPLLSRILSAPLLGGPGPSTATTPPASNTDTEPESGGSSMQWSTFGRRRPLATAIGELGALHRRGSGSKSSSKGSRRRTQQRSTPVTPNTTRPPSARTSTPSRAQTNETPPSQPNSPAGTLSSSSGSKSYSVRSRRPVQTHPEPIPDDAPPSSYINPQTPAHTAIQGSPASPPTPVIASPRPTRPTLDDSPHTFGRVTPKRSGTSSRPYPGLGGAFLPPLSSTPPPLEHQRSYSAREPPSTYPPRSGTRPHTSGSTVSFPTLPAARSQAQTRPRAADVFQAEERERGRERTPSFGARFRLGTRVSGEDGVGRRSSADWSAAEAVRGEGETWPASVSREMVRLALAGGEGGDSAPASVLVPVEGGGDGAEAGEVGTLREAGTKNPTLFGSTGEDRRRFFRAGRKKAALSSPALTSTASSAPQASSPHSLQPAFSVSPPSGPSASSSKSVPVGGTGVHDGGLAPHVSVTAPTPSASPSGSRMGTLSSPIPGGSNGILKTNLSAKSQGKRKVVDSEDETPLDEHGRRPILKMTDGSRDSSYRTSDASHAPSSFRHSKRIRLSTPSHSPTRTRPLSPAHQSPPTSPTSRPASSLRTIPANPRSLSQSSIPLRAIISPRPPSVSSRSAYHMRDPALAPPRRQSTQWTGGARKREDEGTRAFPLQGWAFIAGFLLFPVWWIAALAPVDWGWRTRDVQDGKGMWAEEELAARKILEYDIAYTWRRRCRLMSLLGLLVYIPLIVLLAVFIPRT